MWTRRWVECSGGRTGASSPLFIWTCCGPAWRRSRRRSLGKYVLRPRSRMTDSRLPAATSSEGTDRQTTVTRTRLGRSDRGRRRCAVRRRVAALLQRVSYRCCRSLCAGRRCTGGYGGLGFRAHFAGSVVGRPVLPTHVGHVAFDPWGLSCRTGFLAASQSGEVAALSAKVGDRFAGVDYEVRDSGAIVIRDSIEWLEVEIGEVIEMGITSWR
uniref:Uncharacterized protein n=1 Tax=Rhodococcus sp. NS1 TaxID=402236 RepID=A0A097SQ00_9NOCA|nr:hypothetical protein LRS1606.174 [Rhodococcus sp. NS1]